MVNLSLKELIKKVLQKQSVIGTTYAASWTATSSNSTGTRVTDTLSLPAGTYIGFIKCPVASQTTLTFSIYPLGLSSGGMMVGTGQGILSAPFTLSATTTVYVVTEMSMATTYTYIERGYLKVVRIA